MAKIPRPPLGRLFVRQFVMVLLLCALSAAIWPGSLVTAFTGAMIAFLPQVVFAWMMFIRQGARQRRDQIRMMFVAEGVKFGLTVILFVVVFTAVPLSNPISLLSTYAAVVLLNWLTPWLIKQKPRLQ